MTFRHSGRTGALAAVAASILVLGGCASLAPYGPQAGQGGQGYSEAPIEANRYRVTYNGVGDPGPVADYALLRAAELTLDRGYDWFEVTQRWIDGRPGSRGGVDPSVSIGIGSSRYGNYSGSGIGVGLGLNLSGPSATSTTLEVVMGRGTKPDSPVAYDAREVTRALGWR